MKKFFIFCTLIIGLLSCSKDDDVDNTEYYAQYEVYSHSTGVRQLRNVYIGCKGGGENSNGKVNSFKWSATKGPFKKGETVFLSVRATDHTIEGRISVCKNGNPFVTVRSGTKKNELYLSYKIE